MERAAILEALLPASILPLWVPLLTFYREAPGGDAPGARADIDVPLVREHAHALARHVPLWMVAGSTGDGWDLDDAQLDALLRLAASDLGTGSSRVLAALLRPTTAGVLAALERLHRIAGTDPRAALADNLGRLRELGWVGLCICPPVGAEVTQAEIVAHYEAVLAAASMPLALYQLPQVTGCRIEPATFARLVDAHPEIILFKDSSGEDRVVHSALATSGPLLVRGAESAYAHSLRVLGGAYDGLLLSTANVFAPELEAIVAAAHAGERARAQTLSTRLEQRVAALFAAGADAPVGNAFANVNRAVAHIRRHGDAWAAVAAPLLFDGSRLPMALLARIAEALAASG